MHFKCTDKLAACIESCSKVSLKQSYAAGAVQKKRGKKERQIVKGKQGGRERGEKKKTYQIEDFSVAAVEVTRALAESAFGS